MYPAPTQPGGPPSGAPQKSQGIPEGQPFGAARPPQVATYKFEERKTLQPPIQQPAPATTVPLQLAKDFLSIVKKGNIGEIIAFINQYNLDVTKIVDDNFRHTCLFYAALIKDQDTALQVMKMFIERGVPATYTDILNQTVLYYAAREGKLNCVDLLQTLGCSVNHRDQYGQTPLYYAAREGHYEIVKKLIQNGADVNNEDANGQSALFYAAREGRKEICELLIQHGALVNKQDKRRQTALYWAKKHGKNEVVDLLIAHGATPPKEPEGKKTKEKASKKSAGGGKKKQPDRNAPKKYVLTVYKDGMWRPLTPAEIQEFVRTNPEVGSYLQNPALLESLNVPPEEQPPNIYHHWDKAASKIINHLWKQQGAWHFHQPVDPIALRIPDYSQIIKRPMDFGTIKKKLATGAYNNCKEFVGDVEQVFDNCILYNGETSDFGMLAKNLREEFRKQCQIHSLDFYMSQSDNNNFFFICCFVKVCDNIRKHIFDDNNKSLQLIGKEIKIMQQGILIKRKIPLWLQTVLRKSLQQASRTSIILKMLLVIALRKSRPPMP
eukprot:TRINITY_DN120490_c2_g1_i1.p1 TRINITY_DN120490_c2_g1~~TRINITY_DN120490_c2_g1_i1.p1  ORF type:complete len:633 (+),score=39.58 TRINITY_DN120490_c2_g1_i1:249-1901(+)